MHSHFRGSHREKFDNDDFNSFRGIACEGQTDTHTDICLIYITIIITLLVYIDDLDLKLFQFLKVSDFENKMHNYAH